MPYIPKGDRIIFDNDIETLTRHIDTIGKFTYVVYMLCIGYLAKNGKCYDNFAAISGALVSTGQELYRRVTAPYEDTKIKENGDV